MGTDLTFVALGDSFTEGLEDDLGPSGRHRGWADRVAAALAVQHDGIRYANLAVRGRLLKAVVAEQVPIALTLTPTLVSFHAGPNDILRPTVDLWSVLSDYDDAVSTLRSSGCDVVLFTVITRVGGTGRTADRLAGRFEAFNAGVRKVADVRGCTLADLGGAAVMQDRRLFHEDRLHLRPEGHARVAAAVLEGLGVDDPHLLGGRPGWWSEPLEERARRPRRDDVVEDVRWVRRHLLPWVGRRVRGVSSGDGMQPKHPELVDVLP